MLSGFTIGLLEVEIYMGAVLGCVSIFMFTSQLISGNAQPFTAVMAEDRDVMAECTNNCIGNSSLLSLLAVALPVLLGVLAECWGQCVGKVLLGMRVVGAYTILGSIAGLLLTFFMGTASAAWSSASLADSEHSKRQAALEAAKAISGPLGNGAVPSIRALIKLAGAELLMLLPVLL